MKFSVQDFSGKCDQIRSFLHIWSHLLKKSLMKNFIFRAVKDTRITSMDIVLLSLLLTLHRYLLTVAIQKLNVQECSSLKMFKKNVEHKNLVSSKSTF